MGFIPGKQTATPVSPKPKSSSGGGGGGSGGPTPLNTSPALAPSVRSDRMATNRSRGAGDSSGRSPSDPNFGRGPQAPSSQFRTGGGSGFVGGKVKTRVVSRAEFQRSLAKKQQRARAIKRFLKPLQEQRRKTGASDRRRRIDALTTKQRIVKEIKGFPLTELGRTDRQSIIDFIDRQFDPFLGRRKALFTVGSAGKIEKNLDTFLRKKGTKAVSRRITPKGKPTFDKRKPSVLKVPEKKKGLAGARQTLSKQRDITRTTVQTDKSQLRRTFQGIVVLGGLGLASGIIGVADFIRHPIKTAKAQIEAIKHPRETIKALGQEFTTDPVGVVAEFYAFAKTINVAGKGVKRSPAGRWVQEELFIRSQPKEVQLAVRRIIKAARIQQKINPLKIKSIRKVNFLEVVSLNKLEAQALAKTLRNTDSIVFGSWAARTLGGKKLPKPKDVDLATADIDLFNRKFLDNLPGGSKKNYVIKGEKILRKNPKGPDVPILDVKPIDRLIPQKSLITRRGRISAVGYVRRVVGLERFRKVLKINGRITSLKRKLSQAKTKKARSGLKRQISKLKKQRSKEVRRFKPSELARLKKIPAVGGLDFPTGKIVKVQGIKLVGFGEQTTRKALGTLQVLIEKNVRRQKDPSSLVIALEVQRAALKRSKKLTLFKRRKLKTLDDAISLLKSKAFSKLLKKKVPGLTKEYPLVAKINVKRLKKVNFKTAWEEALRKVKVKPVLRSKEKTISVLNKRLKFLSRKKSKTAKTKRKIAQLQNQITRLKGTARPRRRVLKKKVSGPRPTKKRPSKLPKRRKSSKLSKAKKRPSQLPSKLKRSKLKSSRLSRLKGSKVRPSKIAKSKASKLKTSKLQPSRISKLTPSKLRPSKLRPSKVPAGPPSRLTPSRIRSALERLPRGVPRPPPVLLHKPKTRKEEERVIRWVRQQRLQFRPSLVAILFNITGIPKRKLTGFEIRPIPIKRRINRRVKKRTRKRPKRLKRKASSAGRKKK